MANLSITVIDGNNIAVAVSARATQTVTIDRSVSGPSGPPGITWKGAWNSSTYYILNDAVSIGGTSYICILANTNQTPPNGTYWNVLAQSGSVTSVGLSAPALFTVSGSPITSSGTLALTYSGTALPAANGGTGLTSLTAGYIPFGAGTSAFGSSSNLFWDSVNGRLGVGTSSPTAPLSASISSAGSSPTLVIGNTDLTSGGAVRANFISGDDGTAGRTRAIIEAASDGANNGRLAFYTRNAGAFVEQLRITYAGNVGIGTASPGNKLDVQGATVDARVYSTATGGKARMFVRGDTANMSYESDGTAQTSILFDNVNGQLAYAYGLGASGYWRFLTAGSERIRINNTGNVGIGTASPSQKLDVQGNVNLIAGGQMFWGGGTSYYIQSDNSTYMRFATASTIRMYIDSSGSVGIGTSPSANTLLDVRGTSAGQASARFAVNAGAGTPANLTGLAIYYNLSNGFAESSLVYGNSVNSYLTFGSYNGTSYTESLRITAAGGVSFGSSGTAYGTSGQVLTSAGNAPPTWTTPTTGTVTSVSWTGGIVSVATATTTPAFTVAGTSGGIPYFSSASTWASSAALAANAIVLGGGAGAAPATTTTGTGVVTALGNATNATGGLATTDGTATLTNKRITSRVLVSSANSATPTINTDNYDMMVITGQSVAITSFTTNLTGTPTNGQKLWISVTGTGAVAITWGASFESSTVTLPTTTVTTARLDVGFVWNAATNKWRCVASA